MTFHTHICTVGFFSAPSIAVVNSGIIVDKLILLNNRGDERSNNAEVEIRDYFSSVGKIPIETIEIDPYDYHGVFNEIISIGKKETVHRDDVKIHINFTSGTNIMAGAACSAAQYLDCELYYVLNENEHPELDKEDLIKIINPPNMFDVERLNETEKKILICIFEKKHISNDELMTAIGFAPSKLGYYTKNLRGYELIDRISQGRSVEWKLTDRGLSVIRQLPIQTSKTKSKIYDKELVRAAREKI